MKKIVYSILLIALASSVNAQLGNLKNKVPKVKKEDVVKTDKKSTDTSVKDGKGLDDSPKYDSESEIYKAHSRIKMNCKSAASTMSYKMWEPTESQNLNLEKTFIKLQEDIDFLKANPLESKKRYLAAHQANKDSLFEQYTSAMETYKVSTEFFDYFESLSNCIELNNFNFCTEGTTYEAYAKRVSDYRAAGLEKDDRTENNITDCEKYYNEDVPNVIIPERVTSITEKSAELFDEKIWNSSPNYVIREAERHTNSLIKLRSMTASRNPNAEALITKLEAHKTVVETYISSGEYDAYKERMAAEIIENRRLGTVGSTDQEVINFIKSNLDENQYGSIQRVVVISRTWVVKYTDWGYPKEKYMIFEVAVKGADGKCYKVSGGVVRKHEGYGKYSGKILDIYYVDGEMNCANIKK